MYDFYNLISIAPIPTISTREISNPLQKPEAPSPSGPHLLPPPAGGNAPSAPPRSDYIRRLRKLPQIPVFLPILNRLAAILDVFFVTPPSCYSVTVEVFSFPSDTGSRPLPWRYSRQHFQIPRRTVPKSSRLSPKPVEAINLRHFEVPRQPEKKKNDTACNTSQIRSLDSKLRLRVPLGRKPSCILPRRKYSASSAMHIVGHSSWSSGSCCPGGRTIQETGICFAAVICCSAAGCESGANVLGWVEPL